MFMMMNGRNRRGMGGGLFLLPGLFLGGLFGIYVILAVLNVVGIVLAAVFSGLAAAFIGVMSGIGSILGSVFSGIGSIGGLVTGIVIGLMGYYQIRNRKAKNGEG